MEKVRHVDRVAGIDGNASVLGYDLYIQLGGPRRIDPVNVVAMGRVLVYVGLHANIDHVYGVDDRKEGQACVCHHFARQCLCHAVPYT